MYHGWPTRTTRFSYTLFILLSGHVWADHEHVNITNTCTNNYQKTLLVLRILVARFNVFSDKLFFDQLCFSINSVFR